MMLHGVTADEDTSGNGERLRFSNLVITKIKLEIKVWIYNLVPV